MKAVSSAKHEEDLAVARVIWGRELRAVSKYSTKPSAISQRNPRRNWGHFTKREKSYAKAIGSSAEFVGDRQGTAPLGARLKRAPQTPWRPDTVALRHRSRPLVFGFKMVLIGYGYWFWLVMDSVQRASGNPR